MSNLSRDDKTPNRPPTERSYNSARSGRYSFPGSKPQEDIMAEAAAAKPKKKFFTRIVSNIKAVQNPVSKKQTDHSKVSIKSGAVQSQPKIN